MEVRPPPPPPRERREEEGSKDDGEKRVPREEAWHRKAYETAVRAAYGKPWTLDGKGQRQVEPELLGEVFGAYLDGATEREAWRWYQTSAAAFVSHQVSDRPDLTFFRPEQFRSFLDHHGPFPHAAGERRKAAARSVQAKLREEREGWEILPDEVTHEAADGLLSALGSLFPGKLKGPSK